MLTVKSENIFYRWNEHYKVVEAVDMVSGKVVALQEDYNEEHILNPDRMMKVEIDGKELLIQKGMSISEYNAPRLSYSKPIADIIVQKVSEGQTLSKIAKEFKMSVATIMNWADKVNSFGDALNKAKMVRAEVMQDTLLDIADEMGKGNLTKGELEGKTKKTEIMKWSMEKDSPNRFGNKKEMGGNNATIINIVTGVVRDEPLTVEVVSDKENS